MVRFGPFSFDPVSGDLARADSVERIPPQAATVLRMLLEKPGVVVARAELKERVWPDTTVEFDQSLSFCIRQLRVALGDDASSPQYIETLPKRGYRFIAPVDVDIPPLSPPPPAGARRRLGWMIAAASILVVAALVAANAFTHARPIGVAVVPFDVDSGSAVATAYRDRLAEATVDRLTNSTKGAMSVMGPSTTRRFMSRTSIDSIRAITGAAYSLSGVIRPRGAGFDVFVQLIRAEDRGHIWVARWIDSTAGSSSTFGDRMADSVRRVVLRP